MRFGIWRSADTTEKNRNIGAQLHYVLYTTADFFLQKFTSCLTFGAHTLVRSEAFLDYP